MSYYNLKQALEILQQNLPDTVLPFDLPQLADLCNCGVLTPMVYYSRFLDTIVVCEYDHPQLINAYGFKGYLTDKQLGDLVYEYSNIKNDAINQPSKLLYNADIHEIMQVDYLTGTKSNGDKNLNVGDRVALFYYKQRYDDNYQKSTSDQKEKDALTVIPDMIRFSATDIKAYIASEQTAKQNNSEQKEIAHLKKELALLNEQLSKQADTPADAGQSQGLAKYNADKAYIINTGKALASYLWSMDNTQAIRTGDMVQQVRQVMYNIDPNLLPDDKAIRGWLSSIAPDYAKKGGKPSNNAPNEISLIMKK